MSKRHRRESPTFADFAKKAPYAAKDKKRWRRRNLSDFVLLPDMDLRDREKGEENFNGPSHGAITYTSVQYISYVHTCILGRKE